MVGSRDVNSNEQSDGMDETGGMQRGQLDRKDCRVISGKLYKPYMDLNIRYLYSIFHQSLIWS
jgi:hypothetical protein